MQDMFYSTFVLFVNPVCTYNPQNVTSGKPAATLITHGLIMYKCT